MGRVPWQEWKEIFLLNQKALGLSKRTLDDLFTILIIF